MFARLGEAVLLVALAALVGMQPSVKEVPQQDRATDAAKEALQ